jgi:4-amino-4-deoxy-L-arabinose transferase-like glycosyltransferase
MGAGDLICRRWTADFDPAAKLGFAGLFGLAASGVTLFLGVFANGYLSQFVWLVAACFALLGIYGWKELRSSAFFRLEKGPWLLCGVGAGMALLFALICAAGPSDSLDWDSLAYHLAVPKLWLQHGQIDHISFIHHSNFPFLVDNLYLFGLQWGGASGAKAFSAGYLILGCLAIFGLVRHWSGKPAAWWSVLAVIGIPTVLWESGTAYIDASHGIWAGLGILLAAKWSTTESKNDLVLACLCLGCAAASKYTGLQTAIAVSACSFLFHLKRNGIGFSIQKAALVGAAAILIASPWLIRNVVNTGNPVFPFFFEKFGGKNWDQFSADIYRDEQQTFGVGRTESGRDWSQIGHAVLGLAYQPGRYTNPRQTEGGGFPTGALGFVFLASGIAWCVSGKVKRFEGFTLAAVGISFLMWFALSQQSRYMVNVAIPLAVLIGPAIVRMQIGKLLAALVAIQLLYSQWMVYEIAVKSKLPVVFGQMPAEGFYKANGPSFALAAPRINELVKGGKVASFDEVFGFFLDVPYFWANPGHSTEIPYATLTTGTEFAQSMKSLGITHCYINLSLMEPNSRKKFLAESGLEAGEGFTDEERQSRMKDPRSKWPILFADGVKSGAIEPVEGLAGGILFHLP